MVVAQEVGVAKLGPAVEPEERQHIQKRTLRGGGGGMLTFGVAEGD
jgi:hypothetical protein